MRDVVGTEQHGATDVSGLHPLKEPLATKRRPRRRVGHRRFSNRTLSHSNAPEYVILVPLVLNNRIVVSDDENRDQREPLSTAVSLRKSVAG
jgi:hypothetical protein